MSVQPATFTGNVATPAGLAQLLADVKRRLGRLEAQRTIIGQATISGAQVQNGTITGTNIQTGSLDATLITAGTITAAQIQAGSITAALIQAGAINASHIQANSITATEIAANAITAVELAASSVVAGDITAGAVTAGTIAAGAVTATTIAADSIATASIQAGAVTATKISVSTLSALTTNMGSLTAGTITGGTIQSGSSGSRAVMDSLGFRGYALDGVTKTFEINVGTGIATLTGVVIADPSSVIPGGSLTGTVAVAAIPAIGGGNLLTNSSFENGTNNWANSSNALLANSTAAGTFRTGSQSLQITSSATATTLWRGQITDATKMARVNEGDKVTSSVYSKAATVARSSRMRIGFYDASLVAVGASMTGPSITNSTTAWTRHTHTVTVPATAVYAIIYGEGIGTLAGEVHYWDNAQLEVGEVVTAYTPKADEILPLTVTGAMIADTTVTESKISGTISGAKITDGTVVTAKIGPGAVNTTNIAANAITSNEVAAGAITTNKLNVVIGGGNFLSNSGFEDVVTPFSSWSTPARSTRVLDQVVFKKGFGFNSAKLTITDTGGQAYMTAPSSSADYSEVIVGRFYTSSFWTKANAAYATQAQASIQWYDASDVLVSSSVGTAVNSSTGWQRVICTAAAPAGAVKARIVTYVVRVSSGTIGDIYWVDDVQLEEGDVPTSYAPRTDEILPGTVVANMIAADTITAAQIGANAITATELAAGAVTANKLLVTMGGGNLLTNSGFEDTTLFNWANNINSTPVATSATGTVRSGNSALQMTAIAAGDMRVRSLNANNIPNMAQARPGDTVTISAYSKAATTPRSGRVRFSWYDATSPTPVAIGSTVTGVSTTNSTTDWTRHTHTAVAPAGTAYLVMYVDILAAAIGEVHYWDDAQIEIGDVATSYKPKAAELLPGTIVASMVATDTLTANEIASNAITVNELAANAVTAAKIAANTITASQIASATITATQLAANSITATQIAAGAVTANAILAGSIQTSNLSFVTTSQNMHRDAGFENTGTASAWQANTGSTVTIGTAAAKSGTNGAIMTSVGTPTSVTMRTKDVDSPPVVAGKTYSGVVYVRQGAALAGKSARISFNWQDAANVTLSSTTNATLTALPGNTTSWTAIPLLADVADPAAVKARIVVRYQNTDNSAMTTGEVLHIDEAMMVPGSTLPTTFEYKAGDIQPGSVGNTVISPDAITTDKILAGTITGGDIAATTITGTNIAATTITAGLIASGTITAVQMAAGSITADKINVGASSTSPNLLPNSSFERRGLLAGITNGAPPVGWNALAGTIISSVDVAAGSAVDGKCVMVVAPTLSAATVYVSNSEKIAAAAGEQITFTAYVRKQAGHAGTTEASLAINYTDINGAGISDDGTPGNVGNSSSLTTITSTSVFTRLVFTRTAPTGSIYATCYLGSKTSAANSSTGLIWDCAQAEKSASASSWSLRAIEQAFPGTEILPGSIYTGNITANSIDGQTITGALIRSSSDDDFNARFTTSGITLPNDTSAAPGVTPATLQWRNAAGTDSSKIWGYTSSGAYLNARVYKQATGTDYQELTLATNNTSSTLSSHISLFREGANNVSSARELVKQPANHNYWAYSHLQMNGNAGDQFFLFTNNNGSTLAGLQCWAGAWSIYSDESLKTNIKPSSAGLAETRKLKPKRYALKHAKEREIIGLVAQDVEAVLPSAVSESEVHNPKAAFSKIGKAIDVGQLIALGVQTDIDLDARIDALEAEIAELKSKLS